MIKTHFQRSERYIMGTNDQLKLDLQIYGVSYHMVDDDGTRIRLDPTKVIVTKKTPAKYLRLKATDKLIISGRGTVFTIKVTEKEKSFLTVGLKVTIELENDKYVYEVNDYEIIGVEMVGGNSLNLGLSVKKIMTG